jgi:hypothetical protein
MDGVALAHHASTQWPWIGLLITSGWPLLDRENLPETSRFVMKPYEHHHVIGHIRQLAEA